MFECSVANLVAVASIFIAITSGITSVSKKEFLIIQTNTECEFLLNMYVTFSKLTSQCTTYLSTHDTAQTFGHFGSTVECLFTN